MALFYIHKVAHDGQLQESHMVAHATLPLIATAWRNPTSVLITDNEGEVLTIVREHDSRGEGNGSASPSSPDAAAGAVTALAWHPHAALLLIGWQSGALTLWRMPAMRELGLDDGGHGSGNSGGGGAMASESSRAQANALKATPFAQRSGHRDNDDAATTTTAALSSMGGTNAALLALAARAATLTSVAGAAHTHAGATLTCTWTRRGRRVLTTSQSGAAVLWRLEQVVTPDGADAYTSTTTTTTATATAATTRPVSLHTLRMQWATSTPSGVTHVLYTPQAKAGDDGDDVDLTSAGDRNNNDDDNDIDDDDDDDVSFLLLDGSHVVRHLDATQSVSVCTTQDERVTAALYDRTRRLLVTLNVSHLLDVYSVTDRFAATFVFRRKLAMPSVSSNSTSNTNTGSASTTRVTMAWVGAGVVALACGDDRVRIFDVTTEATSAVTFPQRGVHITHLASDVDSGVLAVGTREGILAVFHAQQQQQQQETPSLPQQTAAAAAARGGDVGGATRAFARDNDDATRLSAHATVSTSMTAAVAATATTTTTAGEVWHAVAMHELGDGIDRIVLGPRGDAAVCTAASQLQMLHETVRQRAWDGFAAATQISSTMVVIESVTGCQCLLHSPHTIRGLSIAFPYIALWTGQQIDLYTIHDATSEYTLMTFVPTTSAAFAVHREGLFYVKDNRLVFATLQLRPIAQLAFAASEGVPALLDVMGDYLAVVSTRNYLRLAHIAPHELRPLGPSRPLHLLVDSQPSLSSSSSAAALVTTANNNNNNNNENNNNNNNDNDNDNKTRAAAAAAAAPVVTIVAVRVNAQGRRVALLTSTTYPHHQHHHHSHRYSSSAAVWGGIDSRVCVYDSDTDKVVSFDFASRQQVPDAVYWNTPEPNASVTGELEYLLLACETHQVRTAATSTIRNGGGGGGVADALTADGSAAAAVASPSTTPPLPQGATTTPTAAPQTAHANDDDDGSGNATARAAADTPGVGNAGHKATMPDMENYAERKEQQQQQSDNNNNSPQQQQPQTSSPSPTAMTQPSLARRGSLGASSVLSDHAHYLVTLFATRDGLAVHSSVTLKRYQICLAGLTIPDFLLASLKINGNPANPEDYVIEQKRLRDFDGLKSDKDVVVREALMKFSYYSTIGNMDEAYRCIKTIKNPAAWQGLARMCVSNGRLDVAAVCLATMQDGVAARALREARESYPDSKPMQLAMLACSLNMMAECEQLLRAAGRYDVITDVFLACGKFEQAQRHAERYDRIRMRPVSYKYAQFMESLQNLDAAMLWYHNAKCTATDVPRIFYQSNRLPELYELLKQALVLGSGGGDGGGHAIEQQQPPPPPPQSPSAAATSGADGRGEPYSDSPAATSETRAVGDATAAESNNAADTTPPSERATAAASDANNNNNNNMATSPTTTNATTATTTAAAMALVPPSKELLLWWAQHCERRRNVPEALRFYHAAKDIFNVVRLLCSVQPLRVDSAHDIVHAEVERARAKYQQQQAMATTAAATTTTATTASTTTAARRGTLRSNNSGYVVGGGSHTGKAWLAGSSNNDGSSTRIDGPEPVGAAYFLGRHYERMGDVERALQYYRHAGAYYSGVRVACRARHDAAVRELAVASDDERLMLECAQYLERHGAYDKAVELYRRVGAVQYALHACVKGGLYDTLHELSTTLAHAAVDARVFLGMARHFQSAGNYAKAVEMLVFARHYDEALRMCQERNVKLTDDMAETMTAEDSVVTAAATTADNNNNNSEDGGNSSSSTSSSSNDDARRVLLCKVAAIAEEQGSWYLACKKYTQAGERLRAMRMLLRAGDTARIVFYANHARNAEMYTMAANFLQSQPWQSDAGIYKNIVRFYTKAKAYDSLANFYDACAQMYIDEQRDYAAALRTLEESLRALEKAAATTSSSSSTSNSSNNNNNSDAGSTPAHAARHASNIGGVRPARLTSLRQRVALLYDFVKAQRTLAAMDVARRDTPGERNKANDVVTTCSSFIKRNRPGQAEQALVEETVRMGDVYAMLVQLYFVKLAEPRNALKVLESMAKQRIEAQYFVEMDVIERVCAACGRNVADVVPFTMHGGTPATTSAAATAAAEQSPSAAATATMLS